MNKLKKNNQWTALGALFFIVCCFALLFFGVIWIIHHPEQVKDFLTWSVIGLSVILGIGMALSQYRRKKSR